VGRVNYPNFPKFPQISQISSFGPGINFSDRLAFGQKAPFVQSQRRSTVESIQSGLFYGAARAISEIIERIKADCFAGQNVMVIGTGGLSRLFDEWGLFDKLVPDLVLHCLYVVWRMNS
jgi:pantothenate kinase type III